MLNLLNRLYCPIEGQGAEPRIIEGFVNLNIDKTLVEDFGESVKGDLKHGEAPLEVRSER